MYKLAFSLLSLGTTVGGIFAGTIQQNLSQVEKPYIDILFEEIAKDMRKFSEENLISEKVSKKINKYEITLKDNFQEELKDDNENLESKYTFSAWTNLWVGLLSNYVKSLFLKNKVLVNKVLFTLIEKEKAFQKSEEINKNEIKKFEQKFKSVEDKVKEIYKKIKEFILLIEFPKSYKYNLSDSYESPYENYIKAFKWS